MEFPAIIWNTRSYFFWLLAASVFCWLLERLRPWRRHQPWRRRGLSQDVFFLVFNGHYFGLLLAIVSAWFLRRINAQAAVFGIPAPEEARLLGNASFSVQFTVFFLLKDFMEWCVHRLLHRFGWLWEFHKLHHTIQDLDWIGNFRFHWMEIVVYRSLTWLPLVLLGVRPDVLLVIAVITTFIGHLNHANLRIDWGPFRYVLNSSRMHVWHHDIICHKPYGQNFAIVGSLWDWLFGTAYFPGDREYPDRLGFKNMESFPQCLPLRVLHPFGTWAVTAGSRWRRSIGRRQRQGEEQP